MIARSILIFVPLLTLCLACSSSQKEKSAQKQLTGSIEISNSWVRPATEGMTSGGYFSIYNGTAKSDTLIGIDSEGVESADVHKSYTTGDGLSGMTPAGRLAIPSGDSLVLEPGGYHVMLMNLKKDIAESDTLELILEFTGASAIKVLAAVKE